MRTILITLLLLIAYYGNSQVNISKGNPTSVCVRKLIKFTNNTGIAVNDLHFRMFQRDQNEAYTIGGSVKGGAPFTNGAMNITTAGLTDGKNHGYDVSVFGGVIPKGGAVTFELTLYLNKRNALKITNAFWTLNGTNVGKAKVGKGFKVDKAKAGGNGGNPNGPSGGGNGAQQGNGGSGNFFHTINIDSEDSVGFELLELKLLASDSFYTNLGTINWTAISPIFDINNPFPITIPAQGEYKYDFNTTGSYLGGHVYLRYITKPIGSFKSNTEEITFGDHPVDIVEDSIPTLSQWGLILLSLLLLTTASISLIRQRQTALATANGNHLNVKMPLFNAKQFTKIAVNSIPFIVGAIAVISIIEGGLFVRNIIGTALSGLIVAYLIHLILLSGRHGE